MTELPDFLTVDEAARLLRCGRSATYDAIRRGEIPAIRIGRRLRVPRAALFATPTDGRRAALARSKTDGNPNENPPH